MGDGWARLAPEAWTASLRREVAGVESCDGVVPGSVSVWCAAGDGGQWPGRLHVRFDMASPALTEPAVAFRDLEPFLLAWDEARLVGRRAPVVFSGRHDFPSDIGHVNPLVEGWPPSPCLALAGLGPVYDRAGARGVVNRLREWMLDAAAGTLDAVAWHPVPPPMDGSRPVPVVTMDAAFFQERAQAGPVSGFAAGVARITGMLIHLLPQEEEVAPQRGAQRSALADAIVQRGLDEGHRKAGHQYVPWVLVWCDEPTAVPTFNDPRRLAGLMAALEPLGLSERLRTAMTSVVAGRAECRRSSPRDKAIVVVVALRRPVPLLEAIPGLSADPEARRFELGAFLVTGPVERDIWADGNATASCLHLPLPGPALYRHVSGVPPLHGLGLIGAGALGSAFADLLLRAGLHDLVVIDKDTVDPHNLARHEATSDHLLKPKSEWAERHTARLGQTAAEGDPDVHGRRDRYWVRSHRLDVVGAGPDALRASLVTAGAVLDATANAQVSIELCAAGLGKRLLRSELYDGGRLGVLLVGASDGNPDPFDLYHVLCALAPDEPAVRAWLAGERRGGGLEEMVLGFGCASASVRLPKWAVAQHASACMPDLVRAISVEGHLAGAGIGLNPLDDGFRPTGWRWCEVAPFRRFGLESGWEVRVTAKALSTIAGARRENLPNETGGYLFGGWDGVLQRITVVAATPAPPGSQGTPTDLDLQGVARCPVAAALLRRSAGRLHLVGTWHSHPDGHRMPSATDFITISKMAMSNRRAGLPTLMLIQPDGDQPTVVLCAGE